MDTLKNKVQQLVDWHFKEPSAQLNEKLRNTFLDKFIDDPNL
jgi:hypothetical protein